MPPVLQRHDGICWHFLKKTGHLPALHISLRHTELTLTSAHVNPQIHTVLTQRGY